MGEDVMRQEREGVVVLTLSRPPHNPLSPAIRRSLLAMVCDAQADPAVQAIVLAAEGENFSVGMDLGEYEHAPETPDMAALCHAIEGSEKPVVAAVQGIVAGAAFDLVLAAHTRVAHRSARFVMPDIQVGMGPSGGATQRLARLAGAKLALDILLTGQPLVATAPDARHIINHITGQAALGAALPLAREMAAQGALARVRDLVAGERDPRAFMAQIAARRADSALAENPVAQQLIDCVEAAQLLPFDAGVILEQTCHREQVGSDRGAALRHVFTAVRRAPRLAELAGVQPRKTEGIGLAGGGALAVELAVACLDGGLRVALMHPNGQTRAAVQGAVLRVYEGALSRGRLSEAAVQARMARLDADPAAEEIASLALVIDGFTSDTGAAEAVWQAMALRAPQAIVVTTQSAIDLRDVPMVARHGRVVGMGLFRPAHVVHLAEIGVAPQTAPQDLADVVGFVTGLGKLPVRAGNMTAGISARLTAAMQQAGEHMLRAGLSPYAIDAAMTEAGHKTGLFEAWDRQGFVQAERLRQILRKGPHRGWRDLALSERLFEQGLEGQSAGRGFYRHKSGLQQDPGVLRLIHDWRAGATAEDGAQTPAAIMQHLVAAVANEGARLLEEAVAQRASDIDVLAVRGLGWAREGGGPMKAADLGGLFAMVQLLEKLTPLDGAFYTPHPMLRELVKNGRSLCGS